MAYHFDALVFHVVAACGWGSTIMSEPQQVFENVAKTLLSTAWFQKGNWLTSVHPFPKKNPEAVTFHIFKRHWYNDDYQGIHVESFLTLDPQKRKSSYLTVHILHHDYVPGTKIRRRDIARPIVDGCHEEISKWDGYIFRAGKYGVQPFTKKLNGSDPGFEKILIREASRLCQHLGPIIDRTLWAF